MNTTWKIFSAINFIEIVLLVSLFGLMIFKGNISWNKNTDDIIGVAIFLLTTIAISANCLNNTNMMKRWLIGQGFSVWNKIIFWIGVIFLLAVSILVTWGNIEMYQSFHKAGFRGRLRTGEIIVLAWIDLTALLGILIVTFQMLLYFKAKKSVKLNEDLIVDAIGKEIDLL